MQLTSTRIDRLERNVFVVDGVGALLSTAATAAILFAFQPWFGMPPESLVLLVLLAVGFAIYSLTCWFRRASLVPWLTYVMAANLAYCMLVAGTLVWHASVMTPLGLVYFIGEIGVIVGVVLFERRVLRSATP